MTSGGVATQTSRVGFVLLLVVLALSAPSTALGAAVIHDHQEGLPDLDARQGSVAPTAEQRQIVQDMGARVRWNRFGTPQSLIKYGGWLASGLTGTPAGAAREWIRANRTLFRLTDAEVTKLELVNVSKMAGSSGRAVVFRQRFGTLAATQDGMITVGFKDGKIAYVSSSTAGNQGSPADATIGPLGAWLRAAANIGRPATRADISNVRTANGWTIFTVRGFATPSVKGGPAIEQRARLVAVPTPTQGVKTAWETNVVHVLGGETIAYTLFVNAVSGKVLLRHNRVAHAQTATAAASTSGTFSGNTAFNPPCGPKHPFDVPDGTKSIDVVASAENPIDDIILNLYDPTDTLVASTDTGTSPEAIHYAPPVLAAGTYKAEVCDFNAGAFGSFDYAGAFFTQDVVAPGFPYPPKWRVFPANPPLNYSSADTRELWCWDMVVDGTPVPGCERELQNLAARAPWDHDVRLGLPTFTTKGNQAISGEAWLSPLTPGEQYRPVSLSREYDFPWANVWLEEKCNPATTYLDPVSRNDIDAATANLFAMHNRMHDWSYFLGFTEQNFNLQDSNFGLTAPGPYPGGREVDPEIGNSQAGAITGGPPTYLGRDNANQITLQDGIPGITNMYLWQPIAAGFYAPCVDGDYDMSVIGHEYTHAISNRMVGGPDAGLSSSLDGQARAMGESYSDFTAVEYLLEYGFVPTAGENPFAVGPYVTGNKQTGIRNYGMNSSPLNYSNVQGYDGMGSASPHDDGEIWSALNYDIRQAMIAKYDGAFPASDATLQRECADGQRPAAQCPGNRRWIQIVFDAYLLMAPNVSMLDSRDAYLAADVMRFGGANQAVLWKAFAKRGFGQKAATTGTDDPQPKANFESPLHGEKAITFVAKASDEGLATITNAKFYVGKYEANVTPIADTDPSTPTPATIKLVAGTYDFVAQADGYGLRRFQVNAVAGTSSTAVIYFPTNWASMHKGATASGDGVNHSSLIDDTEATNWAALDQPADVDVSKPKVVVDLGGGAHVVRSVKVSAMLRAPDAGNEQDPAAQNRFTALRQFRIDTCNADLGTDCTVAANFTPIFTSAGNAFPGRIPRPLAPNLILRYFDVPDTAATHVRLVVLDNQCTGGPAYQGDQDNDPLNNSDCPTGSTRADDVRAAELEVFGTGQDGTDPPPATPQDPFVAMTMVGPPTAAQTAKVTYTTTYTNLGPEAASNAKVVDTLPDALNFVSASSGGSYDAASRTVTWSVGTVPAGASGTVNLTARVRWNVPDGTVILNQAEFRAPKTYATPAAAVTLVE